MKNKIYVYMSKVTLDMVTFKALASDTRLDILRALDGKRMSLKDISTATRLNKATLHEHLSKLNEAGLVKKKEREGHKWVYYKLTWKGECLLHPENTRIVVLFSVTFMTLFVGIIQLVSYVKGVVIGKVVTIAGSTSIYGAEETGGFLSRGYSFSSAPIVNLPGSAESAGVITQDAVDKIGVKGLLNNGPSVSDIDLEPITNGVEGTAKYVSEMGGESWSNLLIDGSESSNVPPSQILTWYDPSLQWVAIACLIIFGILLSIGIWRLWKNWKPKF